MSDPTVTAYLTKLLCSHSGRLERNQLDNLLDLSAQQTEQILQEELLRFPQSSQLVLARSPLRICTNYLHPKGKEEEEEKCRKLHLCRNYLRGQCLPNRRPRCRFSHNVFSDHNYAVLQANELSGLNEEEIKVLLFQNDNQLLPVACWKYMCNNCDKEEDCTRLHVCIYFLQGECNSHSCKRSHNLLESNVLLTCSWLSQETIQNFQMLCVLTHNERRQMLREEPRIEEPRGMRGMSQGKGKRRRGKRRAGSQNRSSERRNKGPHVHQQSDSSIRSRSSAGQCLGGKNYNCDDERDHSRKISTTTLESLMDDWFSPNISPLENVQGKSSRTSAGVTPQEGTRSVPSTKDLFVSSNVNEPELLCTPALPVEFYNSKVAQAFPSAPFNFPKMGPPNTASVASIISQPYTQSSYPTAAQTKPAVSPPVKYSNLSNTSIIPPGKGMSTYHPALLSTPSQPTSTTLESGPSITSPGVLTSSTSFSPSKGGPLTQVKQSTGSASLSTVSSIPSLSSKTLVTSSRESSFIAEPSIFQSRISAKASSVSVKSEKSSTRSPSTANQADTPSRKQTDVKPDAANRNQQHPSGLVDLQSKSTNSTASEPQPATNISSVTPQKSDNNLNELGTWTKYQRLNTKKVCSSILSSELDTIYISNPTTTIQFTAGNQKDDPNCQRPHVHQQSDSSIRSRCSAGQRLGDKNYNCDDERDHSLKISTTRLQSLMDDWFSPNISPLENVQGKSSKTSAGVTPQEGTRFVPSTKDLFVSSNVNEPELLCTPALPVEFDKYKVGQAFPSAPFNFPKMCSPNTASVASIISQPYTQSSYPTAAQTKPAVSPPVKYSNLSNTSIIPPGKGMSTYHPALLSTPSQPTFTTLESGPSITSPGVLTSSTSFSPSKGGSFTQVKQSTASASLSAVSSIPSLSSKTLVTSSRERPFIAEPSIFQSRISAKASSVSVKSEKSSTKSPSTANQADTPSRKQTDVKPIIKPDAANRNQQHPSGLVDLQSKSTNSTASEPQPATNISSVTPQKSDSNLNELGTWTKYQRLNTKKVCSSILSSELETIYISNSTRTIQFTAGNQKDDPNCQKMKQVNMHHLPESEMHQKLEFLDSDRVKMSKGSIKFDTNYSKQKPVNSPWKVVNYPPTWDLKAMPATGYKNIPIPQTSDEFSNVAEMFSKTVQGYKVRKVWRIQNPTLWQAYQRQKDQMKKKNVGIDVNEQQLFHGTDYVNITTICENNFDWSLPGTNGILYGQDALYAHNYSPANPAGTRTMFVARVLVGDFIQGDLTMRCPPRKSRSTERYDSYVNSVTSPSLFMVFEKSQVYPEYILEYKKKKEKSACVIN